MRYRIMMLLFICLISLFAVLPGSAADVTYGSYYRPTPDPDIPNVLYVGRVAECEDFSIKVLQQPVVTKSNSSLIADNDMQYLIIRIAITNKTDESFGWLAPDSFTLQDVYKGRIYGTYAISLAESCKFADGFNQQMFYAEIKPQDTLYTSIAFTVYPDVDSWILNFTPHTIGEEPKETIRFQIPAAIFEELY